MQLPQKTDALGKNQPPRLIEKFLENQSKELELRAQELALGQQKDNNAFQFGKEALAVKAADRRDQRLHEHKVRVATYWFVGAVVCAVFLLLTYALHLGRDTFALEIVKAVVFLLSGGAGGYGLAKARHGRTSGEPKGVSKTE